MPTGAGQIAVEIDFTALAAASSLKPAGRMVQQVVQSLADATVVAITFTTEDLDTHGFHSTAVNTARVTPTVAGWYRVTGTVFFLASTTPVLSAAYIQKNGTTQAPAHIGTMASAVHSKPVTQLVSCNGTTDYFQLAGFQDSAGAITTNASGGSSSVLEWEYVRSL